MNGVYNNGDIEERRRQCRPRPRPLSHVLIGCIHPGAHRRALSPRNFHRTSSRGDIIDSDWQFSKEYPKDCPGDDEEDLPTKKACDLRQQHPNQLGVTNQISKTTKSASFAAAGFNAMKQRSKSLITMLTPSSGKKQQQRNKELLERELIGRGYCRDSGVASPTRGCVNDVTMLKNDPNLSDFWDWTSISDPTSKTFREPSSNAYSPTPVNLSSFDIRSDKSPSLLPRENQPTMEIPFIDESPKSRRRNESRTEGIDTVANGVVSLEKYCIDAGQPLSTSTLKDEPETKTKGSQCKLITARTSITPNSKGPTKVISDTTASSNNQPLRPSQLLSYTEKIESYKSSSSHFVYPKSGESCVMASISEKISTCSISPQSRVVVRSSSKIKLYSKPEPPLSSEKMKQPKAPRPNSYGDFEKRAFKFNSQDQLNSKEKTSGNSNGPFAASSQNSRRRLEFSHLQENPKVSLHVPFSTDDLNKEKSGNQINGHLSKLKNVSDSYSCLQNGSTPNNSSHERRFSDAGNNVTRNYSRSNSEQPSVIGRSSVPQKSKSSVSINGMVPKEATAKEEADPFHAERYPKSCSRPLSYPNKNENNLCYLRVNPVDRGILLSSATYSDGESEI